MKKHTLDTTIGKVPPRHQAHQYGVKTIGVNFQFYMDNQTAIFYTGTQLPLSKTVTVKIDFKPSRHTKSRKECPITIDSAISLLRRRLELCGLKVLEINGRLCADKTKAELPSTQFVRAEARCEVLDPKLLQESLDKPIGQGASFGFGMLRVEEA